MTEFSDPRTDLPQALEQAVAAGAVTGGAGVVAEYPAHLPAVRVDKATTIRIVGGLIRHAVRLAGSGQVGVSAAILAGEQPSGDPRAAVRVSLPAGPENASQALELAMELEGEDRELDPQSLAALRSEAAGLGCELSLERDEDDVPSLVLTLPLLTTRRGEGDLRSIVESHLVAAPEAETLLILVRDPERLSVMTNELIEAGYRVLSTTDGSEVLSLARAEAPDLILLDMLTREPGALDLAMVLKQDASTLNVPVLFLTSMGEAVAGEERLGTASFLVRPRGTGALISTIQAVLGAGVSPSGRVLVVEPDDATRDTLVMMIQAHGYRVTEAAGAEEAVALAEHIPPELVLVNADLAQARDYWLLRGLRQLGHAFDIFVLAEMMTEARGREAVDRGASGFSETGKLSELLDEVQRRRDEPD